MSRRRIALSADPLGDMLGVEAAPKPAAAPVVSVVEATPEVVQQRVVKEAPAVVEAPVAVAAEEPVRESAVSKSAAYRIGTRQDPYLRGDGTKVRPLRLTLPVQLIADLNVLAAQRDIKVTAIAQELLEQYVREHKQRG